MFSFPSLPQQWEKRLVRYLLSRLDLLEESTLGDLSNLEGSLGRNSVFTVKDVQIKVEKLRDLIQIPERFELKEAVIGTLSISLPANLLISGAAEITVNNVKLAVEISPSVTPDDTSDSTTSPPSTPRPGDRPSQSSLRHGAFSDGPESPATAEDLAESFLQSQSQTEKQQLMSLYAEAPMTSSVLSSTTATSESEEEEELGVGTAIGLPSVLANIFKGIADKMVVQVRRVNAALEITLPEDRGGEKVLLEFEVEEVEVEGVSKNVPFTIVDDGREKPRREGKRRITLENICGFVTSVDSMFGMEDSHMEQSTIFGEHSEIPTEMRAGNGGNGSVAEEHGEEASHEKPTALIFLDASRLESVQPTYDQPQAPLCPSAQNNSLVDKGEDGAEIERNNSSEGERFTDFEDSDEEVLAFAPPSMHSSSSRSPHVRHSQVLREAHFVHDIDSEDDGGGGGAAFAPLMRRSLVESVISTRSPPICSPNSTPRDSDPFLQSSAIQCAVPQSVTDHDGSEDEMDQEASRMLSQSTIFSREEADSLYLSATSGMLHSKSELRMSRRHQRPIEEAHEIDSQEIEQRLDKLINGESSLPTKDTLPPLDDFHRSESLKSHRTHRKIRKKCLELDIITIYYPSLSAGITAVVQESPPPSPQRKACSPKHNMPGTFSMYASKHIQKSPPPPRHATSSSPPTQHRTPPRVKIVDSVDARPAAPVLDRIRGDKNADIEIVASSIRGTVDIHTEKMLACAVEVIQNVLHEEASLGSPKPTKITPHKKPDEQQKTVQIVAEKIDLRMVKHLGGFFDDQHEDIGDETIQLQCLLKDVKVFRKGLPDEASTSKLSVKKFALNDEEEGIITFLPSASPSSSSAKIPTSQHRRRSSTNSAVIEHDPSDDDDITVIFSRGVSKVRVNVVTLPLKIRGDLKRLEETFSAFGGVGSVLASTTASTATIRNSGRPPLWQKHDSGMPVPRGVDIKVDCRIGGIFFDVVGTSAQVNLETSPVKIKFQSGSGVTVGIDKMKISAPSPDRKDLYVVINESTIQFASRPTQEDLGRLLELLTPSKDKFDDDDILIDTLLRQREQGSVLRVHLTGVRGELLDMAIFDKLKGLGDEVIQVLTVTDFVAGDERPGLLTLVNVDVIYSYADFGGGMGRMEVEMASVGLTHVSTPSLLAMAIGTIGVRRNDHEVLLGEGLDRRIFSTSELDRPMIMVRMVGDEPEPVVKIKLWNVRVEYSVQTLMELLESPEGATGEELAQEMVNSIVRLPPQMKPLPADTGALGFDIAIKDSAVALNPLDLKSRGLIIFTDARLQAALPVGGTISAGMEVKKASVMIIDHVDHLISVDPGHIHSRKNALSGHLTGFASMGYVPVVTISSAMASLRVVDRAVDLDIKDDLLLIESCADSTQTLIAILNGLKPPAAEAEEIRYCTEVLPINMLQSLTEDAFTNPSHELGDGFAIDDDGVMLEVELGENLPTMSTFVESFYGHRGDPALGSPEEDLADSLLEEDLSSIRTPTLSRQGSGNDSIFMENIAILDSEPTKFIEDHFGKTDCKRRGKKSLNQRAVEAAEYFPLRVRIRDVHALFNLHDGYDWQRTRDTISQAVRRVESKVAERRNRRVSFDLDDDEDSVVDDFLFNSIYIGVPANRSPGDLTNDINKHIDDHYSESSFTASTVESARPLSSRSRSTTTTGDFHHPRPGKRGLRLNRSRNHKMQFEAKGINIDFLLFPPGSSEVLSSVDVRIRDFEIFDNVPTSTWRKFVTYCQDCGERESGSDMVRLECLVVKPVPGLSATELVLKVSILPLRLHVDQDTLDFLTRFFEFKDDSIRPLSVGAKQPEEPFLQRVEVNSVSVKLDYKPKYVDYAGLRSGHTTEFMNFFILEEADMVLRRVILHGISGFTRMGKVLNDTWMPDVKNTQLGDVLAGVAPVRSLVNLGKGARDLVVVPVREYKKDGRIVRSLQKGVGGFVRNTAGELVRLGAKVAVGTQALLQSAEGALSGGSSAHGAVLVEIGEEGETESERVISLYADQPESIAQGLRGASRSLKRNFGEARDAILTLPAEMAERGDARGAATAFARAAPIAVIRPVIGVSEAVSRTLMGVGNAMEPERRRRRDDKYKRHH